MSLHMWLENCIVASHVGDRFQLPLNPFARKQRHCGPADSPSFDINAFREPFFDRQPDLRDAKDYGADEKVISTAARFRHFVIWMQLRKQKKEVIDGMLVGIMKMCDYLNWEAGTTTAKKFRLNKRRPYKQSYILLAWTISMHLLWSNKKCELIRKRLMHKKTYTCLKSLSIIE